MKITTWQWVALHNLKWQGRIDLPNWHEEKTIKSLLDKGLIEERVEDGRMRYALTPLGEKHA